MKELTKRVLFAVPAAALMLYVTWLGGLAFQILFGVITVFTMWEISQILKKEHQLNLFPLALVIASAVWFFDHLPEWSIIVFLAILAILFLTAFITNKTNYSRQIFGLLFTGMYAPLGFLMIVNIRNIGDQPGGFWLVLSFFLMIWGNDVFAYFGGKTWGRRKLAPTVSPNKTWEGFWFGFLGAATGFIIAYLIANPFPVNLYLIIPAVSIVGVLGPIGDLAESKLKRMANVKDSSKLLPGHGGFFDRFDSMILSSPFIFFLYHLVI